MMSRSTSVPGSHIQGTLREQKKKNFCNQIDGG